MDTATSPGKGHEMEVDKRDLTNPAAKRTLHMNEQETLQDEGNLTDGKSDGGMPLITDGMNTNPNVKDGKENNRSKRTKKDGADSPSLGSAGSFEDPVRSQ
jgi:hypothetical protein